MSDEMNVTEALEARLMTLERQTEWLAIELANIRNVLVSVVTVASEALLSDN
jgi:hypothetical protein